jgi:hypothetical protein
MALGELRFFADPYGESEREFVSDSVLVSNFFRRGTAFFGFVKEVNLIGWSCKHVSR